MGIIINNSPSVSNSSFASGSIWFVNRTDDNFSLNLFNSGGLHFQYNTTISNNLLISAFDGVGHSSFKTVTIPVAATPAGWRHFAFALDTSVSFNVLKMVINGVNASGTLTPAGGTTTFQMGFANGTAMGVPNNALTNTSPVAMADFQLWVGKFIDPTISGNFNKFITITNGIGKPANPELATTAFGQQTLLFRGKASDASFWINRGTAGAFTKVGTVSDYTPTPSYG